MSSSKDNINNKVPAAAVPVTLLSAVPPPSELPTFILNQVPDSQKPPQSVKHVNEPNPETIIPGPDQATQSPSAPNTSDFKKLVLNPEPVVKALAPLTQASSSLFGWVKGAADVSGGLLQKIGEKAMSSMDTLVTTLDPQMKEYIRSGGDVEILVATDKEDKFSPVREAFQLVFGRATLMPVPMNPAASTTAAQPVGFQAALKACQDRILQVRSSNGVGNKLPVIAVENFLVEVYPEHWFDVGMIVLEEPEENVYLETFTQMTPVPSSVAVTLASETPKEYAYADTGYSVTVGQVMATNLQVPHTEWHESYTGTKRSEFIYLAAKTLATLYKRVLAQKEAEGKEGEEKVVVVDQPGTSAAGK